MGVGTSLIVFAVGAVLRFAVSVTTTGFNIHMIGVILMIAGAIGLIIALVFLFRRRGRPATEVYEERRYTEPPL